MIAALIDNAPAFFGGLAVGGLQAIAALANYRRSRPQRTSLSDMLHQRNSLGDMLRHHFHNASDDQIEVQSREFPYRVCVDAYQAITDWIDANCRVNSLVGVPVTQSYMSSIGIGTLLSPAHEGYSYHPTAMEFETFDVGEEQANQCVKHAFGCSNAADRI
jgi:hypothetical protein